MPATRLEIGDRVAAAVSVIASLYLPADSGTAALDRRAQRGQVGLDDRRGEYCVRTAIMPQPMSTPTAAGMIAPSVGMTDPTVAPLPRWASGISATCGKMNGICDVRTAWSRVLSSRIDAQFISRLLICSMASSS